MIKFILFTLLIIGATCTNVATIDSTTNFTADSCTGSIKAAKDSSGTITTVT